MYVPLRDRITTPNSTEVRPKFGRIAQCCRAESSRIIRPKFGKTELRPISNDYAAVQLCCKVNLSYLQSKGWGYWQLPGIYPPLTPFPVTTWSYVCMHLTLVALWTVLVAHVCHVVWSGTCFCVALWRVGLNQNKFSLLATEHREKIQY